VELGGHQASPTTWRRIPQLQLYSNVEKVFYNIFLGFLFVTVPKVFYNIFLGFLFVTVPKV